MRWTILGPAEPRIVPSGKVPMVRARCQCGNVQIVDPRSIKRGASRSCGCLNSELAAKRLTGSQLWRSRKSVKTEGHDKAYA